jgi:hypothetical protein
MPVFIEPAPGCGCGAGSVDECWAPTYGRQARQICEVLAKQSAGRRVVTVLTAGNANPPPTVTSSNGMVRFRHLCIPHAKRASKRNEVVPNGVCGSTAQRNIGMTRN